MIFVRWTVRRKGCQYLVMASVPQIQLAIPLTLGSYLSEFASSLAPALVDREETEEAWAGPPLGLWVPP